MFVSSKNKFEVLFVKEEPYWEGTTLHFFGSNAIVFTILRKKDLFLGKYLSKEKEEDFLELCRYEGAIQAHKYWKNRREFDLLIEHFLNGKIDEKDFSEDFFALSRQLENTWNELNRYVIRSGVY
jgi:hypothetical protein